MNSVSELLSAASREIAAAGTAEALEAVRLQYLGRKGLLTAILRTLKDLSDEERRTVGASANEARERIESLLSERQEVVAPTVAWFDTTVPGSSRTVGHLHLVTEAIQDITQIFSELGFTRVRHPEVESDWYAFEALNMPPDHPARDEWETFFMAHEARGGERFILTPHATSGTARAISTGPVPIRAINIQKCYRRQSDVSHTPMFHQFDGVYVAEGVTVGHLKGVLEYFVKAYFGQDREVRLRPFHFRFTEPSFEVDISCGVCNGKGCRLCKQGWVELGGAGMLHPNVLRAAKLNPNKVSGLAFGWGVERTLLMRQGLGIPDLRLLYENDIRFLNQF
ncbi:MAG: phenylalanine--tRNA ligase subunit alpha [Patescibacteria group bacterium]